MTCKGFSESDSESFRRSVSKPVGQSVIYKDTTYLKIDWCRAVPLRLLMDAAAWVEGTRVRLDTVWTISWRTRQTELILILIIAGDKHQNINWLQQQSSIHLLQPLFFRVEASLYRPINHSLCPSHDHILGSSSCHECCSLVSGSAMCIWERSNDRYYWKYNFPMISSFCRSSVDRRLLGRG